MPEQLRRVLISIFLGLIAPFLMLPFITYEGSVLNVFGSRSAQLLPLATAVIFATGFAIWKPVIPLIYGIVIAIACSAGTYLLTLQHPGNLAPLAFFFITAFGIAISIFTVCSAMLLRLLPLPRWSPLALSCSAIVLSVAVYARNLNQRINQEHDIVSRLEQIRQAELAYAASNPNRAFTCNGPDLPGLAIEWKPNPTLGGIEKNQALVEGHRVSLECQWSSQPHSFLVRAIPSWTGQEVDFDERGRVSNRYQKGR